MTWPVRIGAVGAVFAVGVVVGHWVAPARVVTVDRAVTSDEDVRAATTAVAQAVRTEAAFDADRTQVRIVRVYERPDGGTETTTEDRVETHAHRAEAVEQKREETKTAIEYRDRVEYRERERIVESPVRSNWSAHALIGLRFPDRSDTAFGGVVMRRILGPVEVGPWAVKIGSEWAGGIAVGARW